MRPAFPPAPPDLDQQALMTAIALCDAIARTLMITRALIDGGRSIDLAGLDDGVGLLCAKTLDLPPELGRSLHPHLTAILEHLDQTTDALGRHADG